jgi:GntR family histidine utilization transcriptional repressor
VKSQPSAKFVAIVEYGRRRIRSGEWRSSRRVPSENELSQSFHVSRMTARRALDKLALEGLIVRRRGSGSFVAENGIRSSFLVIRNIAAEVAESERAYSNRVLRHRVESASRAVADALEIDLGTPVYHSLIAHLADDEALQLEYRYVRRDAAPDYIEADLTTETPNQVLQRLCPLTFARQQISARLPTRAQCEALSIRPREPCLLITRVTASHVGLVSYARIYAPSSRYQLSGQLHFSSKISD